MIRSSLVNYFIFLVSLVFTGLVNASIDVYEFNDESMRAEFISLTKELRCPKCQNQDISDSNAPIASDMRKEVHRLLEEGETRDGIVEHMIERFGDFVTYKPKVSAETFMLWYGPWIFLLIGLLIIGTMVGIRKTKQTEDITNQDCNSSELPEDIKVLLAEYDDKQNPKQN